MNAGLLLIYGFLFFLGVIVLIYLLVALLTLSAKDDHRNIKRALFMLLGYVILIAAVVTYNKVNRYKFDKIPIFSVEDSSFTVLVEGRGSYYPFINCYFSDNSLLEQTDEPSYKWRTSSKCGYTYTAKNSGTLYMLIERQINGGTFDIEIYEISIDEDLNIEETLMEEFEYTASNDAQSLEAQWPRIEKEYGIVKTE